MASAKCWSWTISNVVLFHSQKVPADLCLLCIVHIVGSCITFEMEAYG